MKRVLILLLTLIMLLAFSACDNQKESNQSSSNNQTSSSQEEQGGSSNAENNVSSSVGNNNSSQGGNNSSSQGGNTSSSVNSSDNNGSVSKEGEVKVLTVKGGMETACVTWEIGSSGYEVYYKGENVSSYKKIDNELIRKYNDHFRADLIGLKKGNYDIKIVPVINGSSDQSKATETKVEVNAHVREGFAFSQSSPNKTASGAYNDDGTLKDGATVLYVTKDNADSISYTGIKDSKGTQSTVTGLVNIMALRQKGYDKTPLAIRFIGLIPSSSITGLNSSGYVQVKGCYNVTMEGVGSDATCYGWSFLVRDANNVEVRNFGFMMFVDDGISMDTDNYNIWIHNNDFFYGAPGSDSDQAKGDGSCDNKKTSYITVSYNHFWDSGKAILCGMGDTAEYFASFHHNWFDHSDSRHPRIRVGTIHVYNNYYDCVSKYGIGVTTGSSCFAENNYFKNSKKPMLSSLQGTDAQGSGTFSGETGGIIKAFGNHYEGSVKPITYQTNATSFDIYEASAKSEVVPSTVKTLSGGTTYNNFDTSSSMYSYNPTAVLDVPSVVMATAGRNFGGDFSFAWTAADTTSYDVNATMKSQVTNYTSKLVSIGGV